MDHAERRAAVKALRQIPPSARKELLARGRRGEPVPDPDEARVLRNWAQAYPVSGWPSLIGILLVGAYEGLSVVLWPGARQTWHLLLCVIAIGLAVFVAFGLFTAARSRRNPHLRVPASDDVASAE